MSFLGSEQDALEYIRARLQSELMRVLASRLGRPSKRRMRRTRGRIHGIILRTLSDLAREEKEQYNRINETRQWYLPADDARMQKKMRPDRNATVEANLLPVEDASADRSVTS